MKILNSFLVVAFIIGGRHLNAQTFNADYTSEIQTNFADCNFVNLLRLESKWNLWKSISIEATSISIAKTCNERLIQDLQTFSNIEEENLPFALAVCGINWNLSSKHTFFIGIRNVNEDYFTNDITSFYTNSSCGIFPTISCNYPIANYPLSALGLHYCYHDKDMSIKTSIYNGVGHNQFWGHENVFQFRPREDGLAIFSEVDYRTNKAHYYLGNAIHCSKEVCFTPWFYTEQHINNKISIIAGFSHAFGNNLECNNFFGLGAHYQMENIEMGIFTDYANFTSNNEWATELTCKFSLSKHIDIQPIIHHILTEHKKSNICSIRVSIKA